MEKRYTSPRAQKAAGNTEFEKLHGGSVRQQQEVQRDFTQLLSGRTLTDIQKGRLRAILTGAVVAARAMRSKVENRRSSDNDDGSKKTAGQKKKGRTRWILLCDRRLQIWTDGSCLDPRWEATLKAEQESFFSNHSTLTYCTLSNQVTDRSDVAVAGAFLELVILL